jgi:hypothetical protein
MWKGQLAAMEGVDVRIAQIRCLLEEVEVLERDLPGGASVPWPGMIAGLMEERDHAIKEAKRESRVARCATSFKEQNRDEIVRLGSLISAMKITEEGRLKDVARTAIKLFAHHVDGHVGKVWEFGRDLIPGYTLEDAGNVC